MAESGEEGTAAGEAASAAEPGYAAPGAAGIFVSYASQDESLANAVVACLERDGLTCWIAPRNVAAGAFYADEIIRAINNAKVLVLVLSAYAIGSPHVAREIERAAAKRRPVIALRTDAAPLTAALEYFLSASQWVDLRVDGTEMAFAKLAAAARRQLAPPSADEPRSGPAAGAAAEAPMRMPRRSQRILAVLASSLVLAGLLVGTVWLSTRHSGSTRRPVVADSAPGTPSATNAVADKSIAVLPFENLSGRGEDAYLADGMQEEILNALSRLGDLKVISRTSVLAFRGNPVSARDIGQRLGVRSILEGSIRRDGNTLRLTVQLIDARDDRHLLAANYDRDLTHVLGLQSAVARQVADVLEATLTRYERGELGRVATNNGDAYDRYLRAVALFHRPVPDDQAGIIEPKRLLEEALRLDPDYADALALLSQADTWLYLDSLRPEDGAKAKQAFERALVIDPQLPEAQLARGLYALYVSEDLGQAVDDLEAVVQRRPNSATAHMSLGYALRRRGRMAEALGHYLRATDLDPLNHSFAMSPLQTLLALRRYPEAIEQTKVHAQRFHDSVFLVRARIEGFLQHSAEPLRAILGDRSLVLAPEERTEIELEIARSEGHYLDAVRLLQQLPMEDPLTRALQLGFLYRAAGDERLSARSFRDVERTTRAMKNRGPVKIEPLLSLALAQSMLAEHAAALETIEIARNQSPEARDAVNGPFVSFVRSVILVRAGRGAEGYAEAARLLHVPFGAPLDFFAGPFDSIRLVVKDDSHYDALINHPPRL